MSATGKAGQRTPPIWVWLAVLVIALTAAGLLARSSAPLGLGYSPDSVAYLSIAESLARGEGYVGFGGGAYPFWPPLYPATLAILDLLPGLDGREGARWLNVVVLALVVWCGGQLLQSCGVRSPSLILLGVAMIAFSRPLVVVTRWAWSEPLFLLLSTGFALALTRYLADARRWHLAGATVCAALAFATRYTGLVWIAVGAVVLLTWPSEPLRRRARAAALLVVFGCLPTGLWMARNWAVSETLVGRSALSRTSLAEHLDLVWQTLTTWLLPSEARLPLVFATFAALIVVALWLSGRRLGWATDCHRGLVVTASMALGYAGFLAFTASRRALDPIGDRLLAPALVPTVVALVVIVQLAARAARRRGTRRLVRRLSFLVLGLSLVHTVGYMREADSALAGRGLGFASAKWSGSPMVRHLVASLGEPGEVYSNAPEVVYFFGGSSVRWVPLANGRRALPLPEVAARWPDGRSRLYWFDASARSFLLDPEALSAILQVVPEARFRDGTVYSVERSPAGTR